MFGFRKGVLEREKNTANKDLIEDMIVVFSDKICRVVLRSEGATLSSTILMLLICYTVIHCSMSLVAALFS